MRMLLAVLLTVSGSSFLSAQYFDGGFTLGAAHYTGELTNHRLDFEEAGSVFGVFGRYNYSEHLAMRGALSRALVSGADANTGTARNLSFRSEVIELSGVFEYNLLKYNIPAQQTSTPFLFAGLAGYYFNPQAQLGGQWHDLQPLRTEGQGMDGSATAPYRRLQVAVPFGVGFKFALGLRANLGFRVGYRKLFTDYLDDVSTVYPDIETLDPLSRELSYRALQDAPLNPAGQERGNPLNTDGYLFSSINVSVNLTNRYGLDFDERFEIFKPAYNDPELLRLKKERDERKAALAAAKEARRAQRVKKDAAKERESAAKLAQRARNQADEAAAAHLLSEAQLAERAADEAARADARQREAAERAALRAKRIELRTRRRAAVKQQRTAIAEAKAAAKAQQETIRQEDPRYAAKVAKRAAKAAADERAAKIRAKRKLIDRKRKAAKKLARQRLKDLRDDKVTRDGGKLAPPTKAKVD